MTNKQIIAQFSELTDEEKADIIATNPAIARDSLSNIFFNVGATAGELHHHELIYLEGTLIKSTPSFKLIQAEDCATIKAVIEKYI